MKRKLAALLICAMGMGLLAGCGSSAKTESKTETTAETTDKTAETEEVVKADPNFKYDEPVTLTSFFEISPTIMDGFNESDVYDSYYYKRMTEDTNISINYEWFAANTADDSQQKKSVAIASGSIPDFMIVDSAQLALLAKTDLLNTDIGSIFEQYASDTLYSWTTSEGMDALNSASFNGKVIAIPIVNSSVDGADVMWIRRDWLEKLGLEYPKTMDELYNVMVAFRDQDPDGNGTDDTIGMVLHNNFLSPAVGDCLGLFNGFGAYPTAWIDDGNGGLTYGSISEENKAALEYLAKMYAEGLIEEDFSSNDETKAMEAAVSGRAGIQYGAMWNANWPLNQTAMNDPEADWVAVPIPGQEGNEAHPQIKLAIDGYIVVSKKCEHPEAVVRLLNFWVYAFAESGEEYDDYLVDADGTLNFPLHYAMLKTWFPLKNLSNYWAIKESLANNDSSNLNAEQMVSYNDIVAYKSAESSEGRVAAYGGMKTFGDDMSAFETIDHYYQNDLFMFNQFTTAPTKTMGTKLSTITDKVMEYYTKVIMGIETTENFDKFVEEVNALGLETITQEVNEWYTSK